MTPTENGPTGANEPFPPSGRPRRSRAGLYWGLALIAFLGGSFLFCCSGLNFPLFSPQSQLNDLLARDFGVQLPASAVVERGARQAYRDPSKFFAVRMAAADVRQFIEALRNAARQRQHGVQEPDVEERNDPAQRANAIGLRTMGPPPPDWWTPQSITDPNWLDVVITPTGYRLIYSEKEGRVFVFWYDT